MDATNIVVVSGGLGVPSSSRMLADQLAVRTRTELEDAGVRAEVDVIELREWAGDIANNLVTGFASPKLAEVIQQVVTANALIVVSPVFSASYSGLLKSFFDIIDNTALEGMPVLIGATGGSPRHSLMLDHAMRPLFSYLRARVSSTAVYASSEDWGAGETGISGLQHRISAAAAELAGMITGSPTPRRTSAASSLPFEQLLAQAQAG